MNRNPVTVAPLAAREVRHADALGHGVHKFPIEGFRLHGLRLDDLSKSVKKNLAQIVQLNKALNLSKITHARSRRRSPI